MSNVNENVPAWQFNTIPGNANQGAVLMTRSNIGNPPFNQSDFVWNAMEDIIGTANVKLEYSEPENKYRLYKAKGHRDEEGEWSYEWTKIGEFDALTPETVEMLRVLKYVEYVYDADTPNVLKVIGVKKDGTSEVILNISYTTVADLNEAVTNLTNSINAETNRATIKENQLEDAITQNTPLNGTATQVTQETNGKSINVKVDNNNVKVNSNNELTTDVLDDTQTRNDKSWSSSKISQVIHQIGIYKGQVATIADLPSGAVNGDIYKVLANGNYYMWNGTTWDDLESDYIPGQGIDIANRVIGVKTSYGLGFEQDDKLYVKVQQPLSIIGSNPIKLDTGASTQVIGGALEVRPGNGLEIHDDISRPGLDVKVDGTTIVFDANGNLKATGSGAAFNIGDGLNYDSSTNILSVKTNSSRGIGISTIDKDLQIKLGNGLKFSSSGAIIKDNDIPLTVRKLYEYTFPTNTNEVSNVIVTNGWLYNLYYVEFLVKEASEINWKVTNGICFPHPDSGEGAEILTFTKPYFKRLANNIPQGLGMSTLIFQNITYNGNDMLIDRISSWCINDAWPGNATNWLAYGTDSNNVAGIRIYGINN